MMLTLLKTKLLKLGFETAGSWYFKLVLAGFYTREGKWWNQKLAVKTVVQGDQRK